MNNFVYRQLTGNVDLSNVLAFSSAFGRSERLSEVAEQARLLEIILRRSAVEEKQKQTESELLVLLADLDNEEDYDENFLKPTGIAFSTVRNTLLQAYRSSSNFLPLPKFVLADGDGGIRVEWRNLTRELGLFFSDQGELKIYWQEGKNYGLDEATTITNTIAKLKWLAEA